MKTQAAILAAFLGIVFSACDNTVDPFTESDAVPFAVFGFLDVNRDTQFVRIAPVRKTIVDGQAAPLPAAVSSMILPSGAAMVWRDSLITLDDGSVGHLYYATFRPDPGATYVLELETARGAPTRAFTRVPDGTTFEVSPAGEDTLGLFRQRSLWRGVPSARETTVAYHIQALPSRIDTTISFPYGAFGESVAGNWRVDVRLERDYVELVKRIQEDFGESRIALREIEMTVQVLSPEWDLTREGSNIENGRGFFASVGRFTHAWMLEPAVAAEIGFAPPVDTEP